MKSNISPTLFLLFFIVTGYSQNTTIQTIPDISVSSNNKDSRNPLDKELVIDSLVLLLIDKPIVTTTEYYPISSNLAYKNSIEDYAIIHRPHTIYNTQANWCGSGPHFVNINPNVETNLKKKIIGIIGSIISIGLFYRFTMM